MRNRGQSGFTFIELSITLLVMAALTVMVLFGQSLIATARIHGMMEEIDRYKSGYSAFRLKYRAAPGDMPNAFDYFGTRAGCANNTTAAGCNGNGDGWIGNSLITDRESLRAHQQLDLSDIIPSGLNGVIGTGITIGVNSPIADYKNATYFFQSSDMGTKYKRFNGLVVSSTAGGAIVKLEDASKIDMKYDDGLPFTGNMMAYNTSATNCTTATLAATTVANLRTVGYRPLSPTEFCVLQFGLNGTYK